MTEQLGGGELLAAQDKSVLCDMLSAQLNVVVLLRWWWCGGCGAVVHSETGSRLHSAQSLSAAHTANITSCSAAVSAISELFVIFVILFVILKTSA